MLIDVLSNKPLQTFYLKDLLDNRINFDINKEFNIPTGWYNLIIEYTGDSTSVDDIIINGQTIGYYIYTGFFTDKEKRKIQPGTVLYDEGFYSIWIHTEIGMMIQTLEEQIPRKNFGTNLFNNFLLTVDKPAMLPSGYPEIIKSYFRIGNGPRWWKKNNIITPYEVMSPELLSDINQTKLLDQVDKICAIHTESSFHNAKSNTPRIGTKQKMLQNSYLPFVEIEDLAGYELQETCKRVGFNRILNIGLQVQYPGESFAPHVDSHDELETKKHVQGPCSFLWDLSENKTGHYYKLSQAGLVPLEHGVFFNENYSHSSYNDSNEPRPLLIIHGERNNELDFYLNI